MDQAEHNERMREASGRVTSTDKLTSFLYELMRDHLPVCEVEKLVRSSLFDGEVVFTNGWLAQYAQYIASRLRE